MSKRGRPFEPGNQLGRGRPKGSKNKKTVVLGELQQLLMSHGPEIIQTLVEQAIQGDRTALSLAVSRMLPRMKDVEPPVEKPRRQEIEIVFVDPPTPAELAAIEARASSDIPAQLSQPAIAEPQNKAEALLETVRSVSRARLDNPDNTRRGATPSGVSSRRRIPDIGPWS